MDHKDSVTQNTTGFMGTALVLSLSPYYLVSCVYCCVTYHHLQMQYRIVARPFHSSIHPRAPGALNK